MKKFIFVLVALVLATPVLAAPPVIDITCAQAFNSDEVIVSFNNSTYPGDPNRVRAFGLTVSVDGGAIIESVSCDPSPCTAPNCDCVDYWVHPCSIQIVNGSVVDCGTCVCDGICTNKIRVEMASLYAVTPPAQSGELFRFEIGLPGCEAANTCANVTCNVTIAEDPLSGGVVMEDPSVTPQVNISAPSCFTCTCASCKGDVNGNGWVELADMGALIGLMTGSAGASVQCGTTVGTSTYNACADINANGWMELADMGALIGIMSGAGGVSFQCPPQPCP